MPRAVDPGLFGMQLPVDHSPLNRIPYNNRKTEFDLQAFLDQVLKFVEDFLFPVIEDLTGIDLSMFLPLLEDLDMSDPVAFFTSLAEMLLSMGTALLGNTSALNAMNLFNIIPQNLLGFIPFSHVGEGNPNLLANPSFTGAVSVQGGKMWLWDGTVGRTFRGSVYCTADGQLKQLRSNTIPVSINQELDISVFSMWSGLTYTGTAPIKLQIVRFLGGDEVGVTDLAVLSAPAANQSTWLSIGDDYTVPGGCDAISLQIAVAATVTAGTIRFDDGDVHKTGSSATFVPFWNVLGVGGPANIGGSVTGTWDNLISGLVGTVGGVGAGLADMFSVGQDVSSWASLGRFSWDILGIRNNKPIDQGLMATSNSNFSLGRVAMQSSAPTIPVTQSASAIGFLRMAESNDKGVVSWLGSGVAGITACYVNIWEMNPDTGDMTLVYRSPNIVGNLSASMAWVIYDYSENMILTKAGELYGIEITVVGSGTHTVAGTTTWIPPHPSVFPKTYAATRNSGTGTPTIGTVIPNASVTYATNIPWIEWGITGASGGAHAPQTYLVNSVGSSELVVPSWTNFVDVIALGSGGVGGAGGVYGVPGQQGGAAGSWATATWARGTEFTIDETIDITVPAGGIYGTGTGDGAAAVASIPGHTVTAVGGAAHASGTQNGQAAGNRVYRGITYVGGAATGAQGYPGAPPGGGGASGADLAGGIGGNGASGAVWIVFRQN